MHILLEHCEKHILSQLDMANSSISKKTTQYFMIVSKLMYCLGLPDIWTKDVPRSKSTEQVHDIVGNVFVLLITVLIIFEDGAYFTQPDLTDRQVANMVLFGISHPFLFCFILDLKYYRKQIKELLYKLIDLNAVYIDEETEAAMVKKMAKYSASFISFFFAALVFYGVDALIHVIKNGETFNTVVVAWPEVMDQSWTAGLARVGFYLVFWVFMLMLCCVYILVISVTICISYQFKNLQRYFYNLDRTFKEDISQEEMEAKYEAGFKFGIVLHLKTLWCTQQWQLVARVLFSSQVVLNVIVIILVLSQMVNSERTLFTLFSSVFTLIAILCSTGLFMLNAGNITLEAFEVSTAMYQSGWQQCAATTVRVRRMVVCAMMQAQKPLVIWALGIVPLSYESYVSIVKSSYSLFSVIY